MRTGMDITVIIPTYNRSAKLETQFKSLLKQDLDPKRWSIIYVNDGSTDDSSKILTKFAEEANGRGIKTEIVFQKNAGQAAARNHGAQKASGRVFLFIDDDMEIKDTDFVRLHLADHDKPGTVVYGTSLPGREERYRPPHELMFEWMINRNYQAFISGEMKPDGRHFFTANVSVCGELFTKSGGFDQNFAHAEDKELGVRLEAHHNAQFKYCPRAEAYHNSGTPSFASFMNRAELYGGFDHEIEGLYPNYPNLSPMRFLSSRSNASKSLMRFIVRYNAFAIGASKILPATATGLHKLGVKGISTSICKILFKIHYVKGLSKKFSSSTEFLNAFENFAEAQ